MPCVGVVFVCRLCNVPVIVLLSVAVQWIACKDRLWHWPIALLINPLHLLYFPFSCTYCTSVYFMMSVLTKRYWGTELVLKGTFPSFLVWSEPVVLYHTCDMIASELRLVSYFHTSSLIFLFLIVYYNRQHHNSKSGSLFTRYKRKW